MAYDHDAPSRSSEVVKIYMHLFTYGNILTADTLESSTPSPAYARSQTRRCGLNIYQSCKLLKAFEIFGFRRFQKVKFSLLLFDVAFVLVDPELQQLLSFLLNKTDMSSSSTILCAFLVKTSN